jgi:hypothetical protein
MPEKKLGVNLQQDGKNKPDPGLGKSMIIHHQSVTSIASAC